MRTFILSLLALIVVHQKPALAQVPDREPLADELRLQAAGMLTDGPSLVQFFRARAEVDIAPERLKKLLTDLGGTDREARERSSRELIGLGALAVPALRQAAADTDAPAAAPARKCLHQLEGEGASEVPQAAARLLARRGGEGATEALLTYLPFAESKEVFAEVRRALIAVGVTETGLPHPWVLKALADDSPIRRAAAADVLAAADPLKVREPLRKLMDDPKPSVRLRAALSLARGRDPKAVSMLILLVGELPATGGKEAEEFLTGLAAEQAPRTAIGDDVTSREKARDLWAEWWLKTENPGLLDEFKKRTMTEEMREQCVALIRQLGAEKFPDRDKATQELKNRGVLVVPLLRDASRTHRDPEVQNRARECLAEIEKGVSTSLSPVVPRLVAYRAPAGSVDVLLKYLPFADDPTLQNEVQSSLNALAYRDGKPAPELLEALRDKVAIRRASAASALCRAGADKELAEVRKLLEDPEATVRMRTALALAGIQDRDAVSPLIASLADLTPEQAYPAEEFLTQLAGEATPNGDTGTDQTSRQRRRDAWAKWWKENGAKVKLPSGRDLAEPAALLGYSLIVSPDHSKVMEIGRDGKTRWELNNLNNVWDAEVVGADRVLVNEMVPERGSRRLAERTFRGDIRWEYAIPNTFHPLGFQRLPSGNILLIASNRLSEITRGGREIYSYNRPQSDIFTARRMPDGQTILVSSNGTAHRIDAAGRELKAWGIPGISSQGAHVLPNGNIVVPQQYQNRVTEYDQNGKTIWSVTTNQPVSAQRLPNGNTLIGSYQAPFAVAEFDRAGKEVWKASTQILPRRVYRR